MRKKLDYTEGVSFSAKNAVGEWFMKSNIVLCSVAN